MPKTMNYDISAYIKTADEVGGDYYDFFYSNNDNTTTAVLGDATGHGMVAGNIVSITKSALNSLNIDDNIDQILLKLNNTIRNIEIGTPGNLNFQANIISDRRILGHLPYEIFLMRN